MPNPSTVSDGAARAEIGVIGGSGFYALDDLEDVQRLELETPFGAPSGPVVLGTLGGRRVAFIARHAEGHRLLPSEVPAHANIYALRSLGVTRVLSFSAVGSLQQRYEPTDAVVPDQLIDRTNGRTHTFFGGGMVAHIGFADPFCQAVRSTLLGAAQQAGVTAHDGGTLVVTEGPAFSSRAESQLYRSWGAAIIGMTALPEAKLAREAELCYGSLCFVTDYDVWHANEDDVNAEMVLANLRENASHGQAALRAAIATLPEKRDCECGNALASALVTPPELVPAETRGRLALFLDRHWGPVADSGHTGGPSGAAQP